MTENEENPRKIRSFTIVGEEVLDASVKIPLLLHRQLGIDSIQGSHSGKGRENTSNIAGL